MSAPGIQGFAIPNWHPPQMANGPHGHWTTRYRSKQDTLRRVGLYALRWQLVPVASRARLTVVLVYPRKYRVDTDNLYARCKDLVDALKPYLVDDSTDWLDLRVYPEVKRGIKETRITLEPVPCDALIG